MTDSIGERGSTTLEGFKIGLDGSRMLEGSKAGPIQKAAGFLSFPYRPGIPHFYTLIRRSHFCLLPSYPFFAPNAPSAPME